MYPCFWPRFQNLFAAFSKAWCDLIMLLAQGTQSASTNLPVYLLFHSKSLLIISCIDEVVCWCFFSCQSASEQIKRPLASLEINIKRQLCSFSFWQQLRREHERCSPTNTDQEQICYFLFLSLCSGFNGIRTNLQGNFRLPSPKERKKQKKKSQMWSCVLTSDLNPLI